MPYSYRTRKPGMPKRNSYNGGRSYAARKPHVRGGEYIDPSRFVKAATAAQAETYIPQHTFADFALNATLQGNLAANGYKVPSPVQDQAIPLALDGSDVIGVASTGTGKTAAFALPILQRLMTDHNAAAIVIAPTRELAQQIEAECRILAKGASFYGAVLIGGTGMGSQLRDLRQNPRLVIGTPGRIKDHLERGTLRLHRFNIAVLDEVDRMLDMGFVNDVTSILKQTNTNRQLLFFSATMDPKVRNLIDNFTKNPVTVSLKASSASENVHQDVVRYQTNSDKISKLHDILIREDTTKVIVFDETQRGVERLHKELIGRGFLSESIHGGKTQGQRQRALAKFKQSQVNILVATDVAARGIDVVDISHVVNFSIPKAYDDYIHRIGRAGRAGQIGHALTFVAH